MILVAEEKPGDHLPFLDLERFRALEAAGLVRVVKKDGAPSSQKDGDDEAQKAKPYRIEVGDILQREHLSAVAWHGFWHFCRSLL